MKVKSLFDKDFENINIKKLDTAQRLKLTRRKLQGLFHQQDVITSRTESWLRKLKDEGKAYTATDKKFQQYSSHYTLGQVDKSTLYVEHTPENKPLFDHWAALGRRKSKIRVQIMDLRKSLKGMEAALTRKEREEDRQQRFERSRHILGMK